MITQRIINILIIEDTIFDYELMARELKKNLPYINIFRVDQASEYLNFLQNYEISVIISDFNVPGFGAAPALEMLKEEKIDIPFIIVSGALGEEKAAEIIKNGAFDLVLKNNVGRLVPTVKMALRAYELKKIEKERTRRAVEATTLQEQAIAVVSHDIKSPLNSIELSLESIQKKMTETYSLEREERIKVDLLRIDRSVSRIKSMISDYIDQLTIDAGGFHMTKTLSRADHICRELKEVFDPIAEKKHIKFSVPIESSEIFGLFDYPRIFQALMNLIGNAIKFTPEHGKVTLDLKAEPENLVFTIEDSGPGIPESYKNKIFQKFWQDGNSSKERGSAGLGLFITKAIIEAHGGCIQVESDLGKGTQFVITIPQGDLHMDLHKSSDKLSSEDLAKKIYLIEDDPDLHDIFKDLLEREGFEVVGFQNGKKAFEQFVNDPRVPHLLIVDYQLPGMNGEQIVNGIRELKADKKDTPILISSAEKKIEYMEDHSNHIFVMKKPIKFSEAARLIRSILND